jgi:hypothetical protein
MQAASLFDGFLFDSFPPFEDGRSSAEVDVGRCQVVRKLREQGRAVLFVRAPRTFTHFALPHLPRVVEPLGILRFVRRDKGDRALKR